MSTDTIPSPAAKTIRREIDSDSNGTCRVCGALREWICDEVAHAQAAEADRERRLKDQAARGQGLIYIVMIDGSTLTDAQQQQLIAEILRLGDGLSDVIAGQVRMVPPVPLKWNAVDAPFETVRERIGMAVDELVAKPPRFARPVVCAWCNNRHRPITPSIHGKQGDACAASVYQVTEAVLARMKVAGNDEALLRLGEWLVQGHYGSSDYDCLLFRFVQNPPVAEANPVCDNCIGERLSAGDLRQIEGQFPW